MYCPCFQDINTYHRYMNVEEGEEMDVAGACTGTQDLQVRVPVGKATPGGGLPKHPLVRGMEDSATSKLRRRLLQPYQKDPFHKTVHMETFKSHRGGILSHEKMTRIVSQVEVPAQKKSVTTNKVAPLPAVTVTTVNKVSSNGATMAVTAAAAASATAAAVATTTFSPERREALNLQPPAYSSVAPQNCAATAVATAAATATIVKPANLSGTGRRRRSNQGVSTVTTLSTPFTEMQPLTTTTTATAVGNATVVSMPHYVRLYPSNQTVTLTDQTFNDLLATTTQTDAQNLYCNDELPIFNIDEAEAYLANVFNQ